MLTSTLLVILAVTPPTPRFAAPPVPRFARRVVVAPRPDSLTMPQYPTLPIPADTGPGDGSQIVAWRTECVGGVCRRVPVYSQPTQQPQQQAPPTYRRWRR
jgi:hypothetical protein